MRWAAVTKICEQGFELSLGQDIRLLCVLGDVSFLASDAEWSHVPRNPTGCLCLIVYDVD